MISCLRTHDRSQSLRFILSLKLYSSFITSRPGETAEHYLLDCRLYYVQRQRLKNNLNPDFVLNFDLLTYCTANCNTEQNKYIILAVLRYIKDT